MKDRILKFFGFKTELDRLSENTMLLAKSGMMNNPNVCINGMSTLACVCPKCMDSFHNRLHSYKEYIDKKLNV